MATSTKHQYTHKCDSCGFQELSAQPEPPGKWAKASIKWTVIGPDGGSGPAGFEGYDLCQRCRRAVIESLHNVSNSA